MSKQSRSISEIREQMALAQSNWNANKTEFPNLTFEDGVLAAFKWLLDESDVSPMDND